MSAERFEMGSPDWVRAVNRFYTLALADKDLSGIDLTVSYEWTEPPAHLLRGGRDSIGYYLRIRDGKVEIGDQALPVSEPDVRVVQDYATSQKLRHKSSHDDDYMRVRAAAIAEGKIKITGGDLTSIPPVFASIDPHDGINAFTAF